LKLTEAWNTSATSDVAAAAAVGREIEPRSITSAARIGYLLDLLEKGDHDHEGMLKLESDFVLQATVLEGTEPTASAYIYFAIANAFVETEFSSTIAHEKAIHCLERACALSEKERLLECIQLLVPFYLHEGAGAMIKLLPP
jgi:hypothetical protein